MPFHSWKKLLFFKIYQMFEWLVCEFLTNSWVRLCCNKILLVTLLVMVVVIQWERWLSGTSSRLSYSTRSQGILPPDDPLILQPGKSHACVLDPSRYSDIGYLQSSHEVGNHPRDCRSPFDRGGYWGPVWLSPVQDPYLVSDHGGLQIELGTSSSMHN